jgi:hypothetical protein
VPRLSVSGPRVKCWAVSHRGRGGRVLHAVGQNGRAICGRAKVLQVVGVFFGVEAVCSKCLRRRGVLRALFDLASRVASERSKQSETQPDGARARAGAAASPDIEKTSLIEENLYVRALRASETIRNNRPDRHRAYANMYLGAHAQARVIRCEVCELGIEWAPLERFYRSGWSFRAVGLPPRLRWRCPEHTRALGVNGKTVDATKPEVRR